MACKIIPFPVQPANDNGFVPPPGGGAVIRIGSDQRIRIEQTIEMLISLLDASDGDPDVEEDDDYDDTEIWGEGGDPYYYVLPVYGVDQTQGPLNEAEASDAQREYELQKARAESAAEMARRRALMRAA